MMLLFQNLSFLMLTQTVSMVGSGELEVLYRPIVCVTVPCPQFQVLTIEGKPPKVRTSADLMNFDAVKEGLKEKDELTVKGRWRSEPPLIEVMVDEWSKKVAKKAARSMKPKAAHP